jgi:hypothetical protein
VDNNPDELAKGIDAQLDRAVQVLTQDVVEWKKTHPGIVHAGEGNPAGSTGAVAPMK